MFAHPAPPLRTRMPPVHGGQQRAVRLGIALLCAAILALGSGGAHADSDHDHDRARQALQAGEVLPLATILARVERDHPGRVLDVELEREKFEGERRWVYEIKLLTPSGARQKLLIDAKSGARLASKRRD